MVTQTADGKVLFQFFRPSARHIVIAGDFNGWQQSFQMTRGRDGWWRSQIELAPGVYRFRYLADGQWFTDYAAFGLEPGPFGWNSVVRVEAPVHAATPAPVPAASSSPAAAPASPAPVAPRYVPEPVTASAEPQRRTRRRPAMAG
jgi:1,4-alpha-glucan branching enzyme